MKAIAKKLKAVACAAAPLLIAACAHNQDAYIPQPPPAWSAASPDAEAEYKKYLNGSITIRGQAFMTQSGGATVKAAGRTVTLDPATSVSDDWWNKAGRRPQFSDMEPPFPQFKLSRRTTTADADGRFSFSKLAPGDYYIRTSVGWSVVTYTPGLGALSVPQGGVLGRRIQVKGGEGDEIILSDRDQLTAP